MIPSTVKIVTANSPYVTFSIIPALRALCRDLLTISFKKASSYMVGFLTDKRID